MLIKTMTNLRNDLKDMYFYLEACKSKSAKVALQQIVVSVQLDLDEIDLHIAKGEYKSAFEKIAGHVMPRKEDFYIRRNYDYGEFWPKVLDEFSKGKVKDVVEMSRKIRRWPETKKKEQNVFDTNEKHIDTSVDNPDAEKKELVQRASEESLLHLDSYCGNKKNKEYWSQMKDEDDEHNEAVDDFIKYIEEVKC